MERNVLVANSVESSQDNSNSFSQTLLHDNQISDGPTLKSVYDIMKAFGSRMDRSESKVDKLLAQKEARWSVESCTIKLELESLLRASFAENVFCDQDANLKLLSDKRTEQLKLGDLLLKFATFGKDTGHHFKRLLLCMRSVVSANSLYGTRRKRKADDQLETTGKTVDVWWAVVGKRKRVQFRDGWETLEERDEMRSQPR